MPLAHTCELLALTGTMVGQAVRVERLVQAERQRLQQENTQLRQELKERYDFRNIIGTSRPMQTLYEQMSQVAAATTTVLIRGESGTGKELIAHALHYHSPRANKPYIKVNCGALPEDLVESGALRLRARRLHRRQGHQEREVRARQRRHALPG